MGNCAFMEKCDARAYNGQSIHLLRNRTTGLIIGNVYIYRGIGHQGL